jgi:hypothetical protein
MQQVEPNTHHMQQFALKMEVKITISTLQILNLFNIIFSLTLIAISIVAIVWTNEAIGHDFGQREYLWYRGPSWDMDNRPNVIVSFDYINENIIFVSSGLTLMAGLAALLGFLATRVRSIFFFFFFFSSLSMNTFKTNSMTI